MKNPVKNIIFDLGGVLLNLDFSAMTREFENLGVKNFEEIYSKGKQLDLFDDLEIGKISPQQFRNKIRELTGVNNHDTEIDNAWNSILLDFPKENKELLFELKTKYRLFLLSNTNEIHINSFEKSLISRFGINFLPNVFENAYYSSRIGLRKPNTDAFDYVLKHNGLSANETIFIDDSIQHIEGALNVGLKAHWLDLKKTNTIDFVNLILE